MRVAFVYASGNLSNKKAALIRTALPLEIFLRGFGLTHRDNISSRATVALLLGWQVHRFPTDRS
jgi:hypothetical protein